MSLRALLFPGCWLLLAAGCVRTEYAVWPDHLCADDAPIGYVELRLEALPGDAEAGTRYDHGGFGPVMLGEAVWAPVVSLQVEQDEIPVGTTLTGEEREARHTVTCILVLHPDAAAGFTELTARAAAEDRRLGTLAGGTLASCPMILDPLPGGTILLPVRHGDRSELDLGATLAAVCAATPPADAVVLGARPDGGD